MLKLAVEAQLPLIFVQSREGSSYLPKVLTEVVGKPVQRLDKLIASLQAKTSIDPGQVFYSSLQAKTPIDPGQVFYYRDKLPLTRRQAFDAMSSRDCTLISVDGDDSDFPGAVNLGDVKTPKPLLLQSIADFHADPDTVYDAIKGCSLVEAETLFKLTQARDKTISPAGIAETRRMIMRPSQGLYFVESKASELYMPPAKIFEWAELEREFFFDCDDPRLVPRGLLLVGPPGTGKTAMARWLSRFWQIPLYRLNMGTTKDMFVGQSEKFLDRAIAQIEEASPCIMLLDEIEKMLSASYHDSVGMSMASTLLWWLAEHQSKVLTLMTCNNQKGLRPELYREGRIDRVFDFPNMSSQTQVVEFAKTVFKSFDCIVPHDINKLCSSTMGDDEVSHARVIEIVKRRVKEIKLSLPK